MYFPLYSIKMTCLSFFNAISVRRLTRAGIVVTLLLITGVPVYGQRGDTGKDGASNGLADPQRFEALLPDTLPGGWKKSGFSTQTSASMNWGGVAYLRGGKALQLGVRHYSPARWQEEQKEARADAIANMSIAGRPGFYGKIMGQPELKVFLKGNFMVRAVGPGDAAQENLVTAIRQVPLDQVGALAESQASGSDSVDKSAKPSVAAALRTLIPDTLAGFIRGRIREASGKSMVSSVFGKEGVPYSINVYLAAGKLRNQYRANLQEELDEIQETEYNGRTYYVRNEESAVSVIGLPGDLLVMLGADGPASEPFDLEAARKQLFRVLDALNPDRLAAFRIDDSSFTKDKP